MNSLMLSPVNKRELEWTTREADEQQLGPA